MNIELNSYGFCIDSDWCYIALSWGLIVTALVITSLVVAYKKWNNRK